MRNTKKMVNAAMLAAIICVSTMVIRIPTPTMGYIHPGDGFVLLSGIILGPLWGGLAAAIGSALTDLIGGYLIFVPGTFVIKGLTALTSYVIYKKLTIGCLSNKQTLIIVISGIIGELVMVIGYFLYEIFILASDLSGSGLYAGLVASATGIPANLMQAIFGIAIYALLSPVVRKYVKLK